MVQRELHHGTLPTPTCLPQHVILRRLVLLVLQQELNQAVKSRAERDAHRRLPVVRRHRQRLPRRNPRLQLEPTPFATETEQLLGGLITRRFWTGHPRLRRLPRCRGQPGRSWLDGTSSRLLISNAL